MGSMWSTFFSYLTDFTFIYNGFEFSLWDVLTADLLLAVIGIVVADVFLYWVKFAKFNSSNC